MKEILDLHEQVTSLSMETDDGDIYSYEDLCYKISYGGQPSVRISKGSKFKQCLETISPLTFFYSTTTDSYDFTGYSNDADIIAKVQTGKGDPYLYSSDGQYIAIGDIFGTIEPSNWE